MTFDSFISAAAGRQPVDTLFINGRVVNVFTGEVIATPVAVKDGLVCGFGRYDARRTVDLDGRLMAPGFIDSHVHIESAMVTPSAFARAITPLGTTCVVADPHEIANVMGVRGIRFMIEDAKNQPVRFFFCLPSCVPATDLETSGSRLEAEDLEPLLRHPAVRCLGEMMNYPGVINADPGVMAKLAAARGAGLVVDGHAPGVSGKELNAYAASGIGSDHECTTLEEALEKLRLGMHIMIREGTGARNLEALMPAITDHTWSRIMWCTDDHHPESILGQGHVDHIIRKAISLGMDPVRAIQLGTITTARYFGLHDAGAVAPGRRADLVIINDLERLSIQSVYVNGELTAEKGEMVRPSLPPGHAPSGSMHLDLSCIDLSIPARGKQARVITVMPGQVTTRETLMPVRNENGRAESDPGRDLAKIVVIDRHSGRTAVGKGFVTGLGLTAGAMASSIAHDSHNIICAGTDDGDMMTAIRAVVTAGGGLAVACDRKLSALLPLPVAGLMAQSPMTAVRAQMRFLKKAVQALGSPLDDPFMTLGFLALPVIPQLKITDQGLVDVGRFTHVDLFV